MNSSTIFAFSTVLPLQFFIRSSDSQSSDWRSWETGPGKFVLPLEHDLGVRVRHLDDETFKIFIVELERCPNLIHLNLSENRRITDKSLRLLQQFPSIRELNLSSCDISNSGIPYLVGLLKLESLNISYCNRLTPAGLFPLRELRNLTYLDLQGIPKINSGIIARIRRAGLTIHR